MISEAKEGKKKAKIFFLIMGVGSSRQRGNRRRVSGIQRESEESVFNRSEDYVFDMSLLSFVSSMMNFILVSKINTCI